MGRNPRCSKDGLNKGAWAASEDKILRDYIKIHGEGKWSNVAKKTGLKRCGKSCRLRWMNYLRPDIKRGNISGDEEELIIRLHKLLGNRWSLIAGRLPGRTDNEIKNYWNTNLAKRSPDLSASKTQPTTTRVQNQSGLDPEPGVPNSLPSNNNYNMEPKNIIIRAYNETHDNPSSIGILSSLSRENHNSSSDLMMDFNVDDFCKILDPDYCIDVNHDQRTSSLVDVGDGEDIINNVMSCETEEKIPPTFPEKMKENWSNASEGIQENNHQSDMDSEFLTLASSFLQSPDEEWPGYDLNVSTYAGKQINQI